MSNQSELQGRGEFILATAKNSEEQGNLVDRVAIYLDGTLLTMSGNLLAEWTGAGTIVGILLGPERSNGRNAAAGYIAREATVDSNDLVYPHHSASEAIAGLTALNIVARPAISVAEEAKHIAVAGSLGHVIGAAAMTIGSLGHRYWRFYGTAYNGATGYEWTRLKFMQGGVNKSDSGAFTATSTFSGYDAQRLASDGGGPRWGSDFSSPTPQGVTVDLGSGNVALPDTVLLTPVFANRAPATFSVYWSDDGTTFTDYFDSGDVSGGWANDTERTLVIV